MTSLALSELVSCLPMLVKSTSRRRADKESFLSNGKKIGDTKMGKRWRPPVMEKRLRNKKERRRKREDD